MAFNFYHLVVNFKPENFHIVIFSACKSIQIIVIVHITTTTQVCSGSVVVTAFDFDSGCPGSNPECGLIYYKALITAQGLPEPSSLRGSTLGTRAAEHKGSNWGM